MTPHQRFIRKVELHSNGCLIWTGALNNKGYSVFWNGHRQVTGHRFSYQEFTGPIGEGLVLDHLCRTPACVNWLHLDPVTQRENLLRGNTFQAANAAKTACPQGHAYHVRPSGTSRVCLTCCRERYHSRRKATTNNQENA